MAGNIKFLGSFLFLQKYRIFEMRKVIGCSSGTHQALSVENPGISYSDILILIPDSRAVYDLIFTLFILLTLSR